MSNEDYIFNDDEITISKGNTSISKLNISDLNHGYDFSEEFLKEFSEELSKELLKEFLDKIDIRLIENYLRSRKLKIIQELNEKKD